VSTPIKRKLATILSADVAGYSRLMGDDEEGTLRLLAAHRAIIDSIIDLHDGRVVNTAGDSVLAEFTSPVEAVRAASEIQEALKTRNESLPESRRMLFRIGVNIGDVMLKGDDLLGDGVNVAARLQTLAEPGGICISGSVFDQIEGKLSLRFQDIGEQTLRNIARPVRALRLHGPDPKAAIPRPRRRARRGAMAAAAGAGMIALAGVAYVTGLAPSVGARDGRQEAAAWETVKSSSDPAALEGYLAKHPTGVHADEARARLAALLASARQAVEAERARAEADLARAKAEAEATRARAEAEAVKARADIDRKKVEEERAAATRARTDAQAVKTPGEAARPVATAPAMSISIAAPAARESRFDGVWVGEMSCPDFRGGPGFQRPQRAVVRNGEMTLDIPPQPGRPRPVQAVGKVRDDDSIELRGPGFGPSGKILERVIRGRFVDDRFTAQAELPARPCSLQLSREPTTARPGG
jgi:class 3 adenylate cyclase